MRTSIIAVIMVLCSGMYCSPALAQEHGPPPPLSPERMQEMKAQKAAYLTSKLGLTAEEAQRFWPVYNAFDEARESLRRENHTMHRNAREQDGGITEADANQLLTKVQANRQKELDLERNYTAQFVKLIGAVRTVELFGAERDFQREVIRRFKDSRDGPRGGRPGPPPGRR